MSLMYHFMWYFLFIFFFSFINLFFSHPLNKCYIRVYNRKNFLFIHSILNPSRHPFLLLFFLSEGRFRVNFDPKITHPSCFSPSILIDYMISPIVTLFVLISRLCAVCFLISRLSAVFIWFRLKDYLWASADLINDNDFGVVDVADPDISHICRHKYSVVLCY